MAWLFLMLSAFSALAFGLGCKGHQTIALIALRQLTPNAHSRVEKLLEGQPDYTHLKRFCDAEGQDVMAGVSTWADDVREQRLDSGAWHFLNLPRAAERKDMDKYCPRGDSCLTKALRRQLELLRSPDTSPSQQVEALMFVIHLVGDLHQPMHVVNNNDRGGNCLPIEYFGVEPQLQGHNDEERNQENYGLNLHGIWDTELVETLADGRSAPEYAAALGKKYSQSLSASRGERIDIDAWAWETHQLGVRAYGWLPRPVPIEPPRVISGCSDDNHIAKRMLALRGRVGPKYWKSAGPILERQLVRAGARLARLLNDIWP